MKFLKLELLRRMLMKLKKICIIYTSIFFHLHSFCNSFPSFNNSDFKTESILLYNRNSDTNVFEKNADKIRPPASLTKIMTFIVVNDCMKNDMQTLKVKKELIDSLSGTDSSVADLDVNSDYTIYELLLCMMVCSGNDAALVLADYFGNGNVDNFVEKMNDKAKQLGCINTHFVNPHGLHHKDHYSSCKDMLKIINYAMQISSFSNIVKMPSTTVHKRNYKNTNKLLDSSNREYYYKYNKGIKTGYHNEAGFCLSSMCEKNGIQFIGIFMGAPSKNSDGKDLSINYAMKETKELCESAFDNLVLRKMSKYILTIGVDCDQLGILVIPYKNLYEFEYMSPKSARKSDIQVDVNMNRISYDNFPIMKGDTLGTLDVKYKNNLLKRVNIVSDGYIDLSFKSIMTSMMKHLFFI